MSQPGTGVPTGDEVVSEQVQGLAALRAGATDGALLQHRQPQVLTKEQPEFCGTEPQAQGGIGDAG